MLHYEPRITGIPRSLKEVFIPYFLSLLIVFSFATEIFSFHYR